MDTSYTGSLHPSWDLEGRWRPPKRLIHESLVFLLGTPRNQAYFPMQKLEEDLVKDVVWRGLSGERIEAAEGRVEVEHHHLMWDSLRG